MLVELDTNDFMSRHILGTHFIGLFELEINDSPKLTIVQMPNNPIYIF